MPKIWNLTPHVMHYDDGRGQRTFPSDGVLRLEQLNQPAEPVDGMATVETRYGQVTGLPDGIGPGDVLMVSTLVGDHWRSDQRPPGVVVLTPDTGSSCKRDDQGRILSVSRFIRK